MPPIASNHQQRTMIDRHDITGLILAGGRSSRMGGSDKGLQMVRGMPLAMHALSRLAPQVGATIINANRNLDLYQAFGVPVVRDSVPDFAGPLAGVLAGMEQCRTGWLVTAPCDSPLLPVDLVARLVEGLSSAKAELAMAVTRGTQGQRQPQPVFCLLPVSALDSLQAYLAGGGHKVETWAASHRLAEVMFEDALAFANINTLEELHAFDRSRA